MPIFNYLPQTSENYGTLKCGPELYITKLVPGLPINEVFTGQRAWKESRKHIGGLLKATKFSKLNKNNNYTNSMHTCRLKTQQIWTCWTDCSRTP